VLVEDYQRERKRVLGMQSFKGLVVRMFAIIKEWYLTQDQVELFNALLIIPVVVFAYYALKFFAFVF